MFLGREAEARGAPGFSEGFRGVPGSSGEFRGVPGGLSRLLSR